MSPPLSRRVLIGRTLDRLLHARAVDRKVRALDAVARFDVIEAAEIGLDGDRLVRDPAFRSRTVIQCHGGNVFGQGTEGLLGIPNRVDFAWSLRREVDILKRAPWVFVPSEATRRDLVGFGVPPDKVVCFHHGIDTTRFTPSLTPRAAGPVRVGFVGRLEQLKGIDFLWKVIEAVGPDAGVQFHLRGAIHPAWRADTEARLRQFAAFVDYTPPVAPAEMPAFYASLDVLLQPSRFENFGLAYVEAMASGLVVFAGRSGGGAEIIEEGRTGFLVDPAGSPGDVVRTLRAMVADPGQFHPMRLAARQEVERRFSLPAYASRRLAFHQAHR